MLFQGDARQHFAWSGSSGTLALAHSVVEETKARTEPFIESFLKVIIVDVTNTGTSTGTERCTWLRWWLSWQIAYLHVDNGRMHVPLRALGFCCSTTSHLHQPTSQSFARHIRGHTSAGEDAVRTRKAMAFCWSATRRACPATRVTKHSALPKGR
jgi:hypothetical protein